MNQKLANFAFETAQFYDRSKKADAAMLAYQAFLAEFPSASQAPEARRRVQELQSASQSGKSARNRKDGR